MSTPTTFRMRDGTRTLDPRLGRLRHFDQRSRNHGILSSVSGKEPRRRYWGLPIENLDQGKEGACVGFGIAHACNAKPAVRPVTDAQAREIYHLAQEKYDPWPGEDYSGTSLLAGLKAAKKLGHIKRYRWCFSIDEVVLAIAHEGPVVLGTNWYRGMDTESDIGRIRPTQEIRGGHCYTAIGVMPKWGLIVIANSWGPVWPKAQYGGEALISFDDLSKLLKEGGEAAVPEVIAA